MDDTRLKTRGMGKDASVPDDKVEILIYSKK